MPTPEEEARPGSTAERSGPSGPARPRQPARAGPWQAKDAAGAAGPAPSGQSPQPAEPIRPDGWGPSAPVAPGPPASGASSRPHIGSISWLFRPPRCHTSDKTFPSKVPAGAWLDVSAGSRREVDRADRPTWLRSRPTRCRRSARRSGPGAPGVTPRPGRSKAPRGTRRGGPTRLATP